MLGICERSMIHTRHKLHTKFFVFSLTHCRFKDTRLKNMRKQIKNKTNLKNIYKDNFFKELERFIIW